MFTFMRLFALFLQLKQILLTNSTETTDLLIIKVIIKVSLISRSVEPLLCVCVVCVHACVCMHVCVRACMCVRA